MGNKIEGTKKAKKLTASEARKKKKGEFPTVPAHDTAANRLLSDRMARRKRGEEVFTDEDE